ncbi:MAG: class I SAM-dependent methyltransferase [Hyphomonadaceae bacterium]
MSFYSRHILPLCINCACGTKPIRRQRGKVVPQAEGVVLELGFGSGLNLPFYDAAKVSRIYALEPEEGMLVRARRTAAKAQIKVDVLAERAEDLSLASGSVDTVLVTYALCTIPDPVSALEGARRVLKPGGALLFCEHGLAPDEKVRRRQTGIEPLWKRIAGGCHLSRDIPGLVRAGGFEITRLDEMYLPSTPRFAGYNYWGAARPRH